MPLTFSPSASAFFAEGEPSRRATATFLTPESAQVQRVGVATAAVADDGDLLVLDEIDVAIPVVIDAHWFPLGVLSWGRSIAGGAGRRFSEFALWRMMAGKTCVNRRKNENSMQIDDIDRRLLRLMQDDPDAPSPPSPSGRELSAGPCWRRIERLTREGVILGREVEIDLAALGYAVRVFLRVTLDKTAPTPSTPSSPPPGRCRKVTAIETLLGRVDVRMDVVARDLDRTARSTATASWRCPTSPKSRP